MFARLHAKLDAIYALLWWLACRVGAERQVMSALDDLTAQVKVTTDTEASAASALEASKDEPAKLAALTAQLKTSADALAAAVAAHATPPPSPAS